ncbi:MAG TPA: hypothetical protein VE504_04065, partial [Nitrososphaeraceae archaeon]|nr:hypothetical protein [Nitrososphaeraceae archaeon]
MDTNIKTKANSKPRPSLGPNYSLRLRDKLTTRRSEFVKNDRNIENHKEPRVFEKVLVVGLGQLGLPVAKYLFDRGFDTYGYDINASAVERAERIASVKKATNFSDIDVF